MHNTFEGEELPMPQDLLEELAEYYATHSGAEEPGAEDGEWIEPVQATRSAPCGD